MESILNTVCKFCTGETVESGTCRNCGKAEESALEQVVTAEDMEANPELKDAGIVEGDALGIPGEELAANLN